MGFNRNDLEGDDDDFNFDDDNNFDFGDEGDDSSFDFGDEPADIGLDNDDAGFGFEEEDMPEIDEEEEAGGGGVSRTFIIIAAIMILLFLLGLGAVLLLGVNPPKSEFELTSTQIAQLNLTTAADALLTETAKAINAATETAIALTTQVDVTGVNEGETVDADRNVVVVVTGQTPVNRVIFRIDGREIATDAEPPFSSDLNVLDLGPGQHTLEVEVVDSAGQSTIVDRDFVISEGASLTATARVPTITPTPSPDATQAAANAILTQQADALTQTAVFLLTPQAPATIGGIGVDVNRNEQGEIVLTPFEGGPAIQAGVEAGDILLAVNGTAIDPNTPVDTVDQSLHGPVREGSGVSLTIRKPGGNETTLFVPFAVINGFGPADVALTATALAILLAPPGGTVIAGAPTQEILTPGALPTQLPETGFFDDLAAGNANVGLIALMALGLVGVIVVSRRVRTANK